MLALKAVTQMEPGGKAVISGQESEEKAIKLSDRKAVPRLSRYQFHMGGIVKWVDKHATGMHPMPNNHHHHHQQQITLKSRCKEIMCAKDMDGDGKGQRRAITLKSEKKTYSNLTRTILYTTRSMR